MDTLEVLDGRPCLNGGTGIELNFHIPDILDEEDERKFRLRSDVAKELEDELGADASVAWREVHAPLFGDHENLVLWFAGAVGSGSAWDASAGSRRLLRGDLAGTRQSR